MSTQSETNKSWTVAELLAAVNDHDSIVSRYAAIDLVVTQSDDGRYHAIGGPDEAIFHGEGNSSDEAIGSWFRQNRESVNFQVSSIVNGQFQCSTRYGVGRSKEELGPNELKALDEILPDHKDVL